MSDERKRGRVLATEFNRTTPLAIARALQNRPALQILSRIESRAAALKEKAKVHHKNFEDRWTTREMFRIAARQEAANRRYPGPGGFVPPVDRDEVYKIAVRQMTAKLNRRLTKINEIKTRMSNAVVRNIDPSLTQEFNRTVRMQRRHKPEM